MSRKRTAVVLAMMVLASAVRAAESPTTMAASKKPATAKAAPAAKAKKKEAGKPGAQKASKIASSPKAKPAPAKKPAPAVKRLPPPPPVVEEDEDDGEESAAAAPYGPRILPVLGAATVQPRAEADPGSTLERLRRGWLSVTPVGAPAGAIGVSTFAATEVRAAAAPAPAPAAAPAATPAPAATVAVAPAENGSVWDTHLPAAQGLSIDPARKVRVFGHVAANHWEGERNVGVRAGPRGQTSIWDAAVGVESRLSPDTEVRIRALSILPAVAGDGDGAGAGSPGGAVNFKDYIYMRDIYVGFLNLGGHRQLNLRFGRVPIAFGDEYLQYDAPNNPLVSHSVPFFWGFDEGMQLYGDLSPDISYTVNAFLDGELGNGSDETTSKAYGFRLEGNHASKWHWSLSYFDNGKTGGITRLPSLYFSRELAAPVGATGAPGGASRSQLIDTEWWEGDLRYNFKRGYLALARGGGRLHDDGIHDRDFEWFKIEPLVNVIGKFDVVARYSGMNVENDRQGYRFNSFESVGTELNFDVNERQRFSVGARYRVNDAVQVKLEHTSDEWNLIPTPLRATIQLDPNERDYTVLQAAAVF